MEKEAFQFFEKYIDTSRPILLGLSGGPDSTCLVQLLLLWNKAALHLVHVDHGWRHESRFEHDTLQEWAREHNLHFHSIRLDPATYVGNKESIAREERLRFFKQVASDTGAQGILLAHHADDQAETVFKRVLEGASLQALGGMQHIHYIDSLCLMRPLLCCTKQEVIAWLEKKGIGYFFDPTNQSTTYLRGRLREEIFPFLRKSFGKEFEKSLLAVASEAQELGSYLDGRIAAYYKQAVYGPWGIMFDRMPEHGFEIQYLVRAVCRQLGISFSRQQILLAKQLLQERAANKQLQSASGQLAIDRGRAFFMPRLVADIAGSAPLYDGEFDFAGWCVRVVMTNEKAKVANTYIDAWQGRLLTTLPPGNYVLRSADIHLRYKGAKEYGRYLAERKIPRFLVPIVPVICSGNEIVEDFLSGQPSVEGVGPLMQIELRRNRPLA